MQLSTKQGKCIYQGRTHSHPVYIHEDAGYRWLHFGDGDFQSIMKLQTPTELVLDYLQVMQFIFQFFPEPQQINSLGLGGGAWMRYCLGQYPNAKQHVVEVEPLMLELCQQYFELAPNPQLTIAIADAIVTLAKTDLNCDVLIMDIFNKQSDSRTQINKELYQHCRACLSEYGVFGLNLVADNKQQSLHIIRHVRNAFNNQTLMLTVPGHDNVVLFGFNHDNYINRLKQLAAQDKFSQLAAVPELGWCGTL